MRPMPKSPRLAALVARHAEPLADAWTRALRGLPDSHYRQRPEDELREWTGRGLAAIVGSLESGDPAALEEHLQRLVRTRERLGFDIEEVLLGLARLDRCVLPVLMEEYAGDPDGLERASATLDDCVDAAVARFGALFATAMRERVEQERRSTACLLGAIEEVARPEVLSTALSVAARHILGALAASQCSVFVRQREPGRFALGATAGMTLPREVERLLPRMLDIGVDPAVGAVLERRQTQVCRGIEGCCFFGGRSCDSLGLSAVVALPVLSRGRPTALALALFERSQVGPDAKRLRLAGAMASTLGSVIDNARLYAESQRSLVESGTLQHISLAMLEETNLADMLDLICRETRRLVGASGVVVLLRSGDQSWGTAACSGAVDEDHVRWLADTWEADGSRQPVEPLVFDDRVGDRLPAMRSETPFIDFPLTIGSETVGVLHATRNRGRFDESDVGLLERIAGQATLAIEHERLHRQHEKAMIVEERHRLSRDLHDSVTQSIYSVTMFAEAAARLLEQGRAPAAWSHLRELGEVAQQALWEMRLLIFELQPPDLDALGLESVLQARLGTVERRAGLKTKLRCNIDGRLPRPLEHGLYRIAQEALNNAIRHARASRVSLTLEASHSRVRLLFEDDGVGFDLEQGRRKGGLGLRGMEERARRMGGCLSVESRAGKGTRVRLEVPLAETAAGGREPSAVGIVAE